MNLHLMTKSVFVSLCYIAFPAYIISKFCLKEIYIKLSVGRLKTESWPESKK